MTQMGVDYTFRTDGPHPHVVRVRTEQTLGGVYVWVDGEFVFKGGHFFAFGFTEHFTFTIDDAPPKAVRIEVTRKAFMPLARPMKVSTFIDGKLMKTEESSMLETSRNGIGPLGKTGLLE